jgi:hypothetical protein
MTATTHGLIGANIQVNNVDRAADIAAKGGQPPFAVLTTTIGNDNRKYVYGKANAALSSGLATCAIGSTGLVAATGGTYVAPTITGGLASGDYAWFAQPGVA